MLVEVSSFVVSCVVGLVSSFVVSCVVGLVSSLVVSDSGSSSVVSDVVVSTFGNTLEGNE